MYLVRLTYNRTKKVTNEVAKKLKSAMSDPDASRVEIDNDMYDLREVRSVEKMEEGGKNSGQDAITELKKEAHFIYKRWSEDSIEKKVKRDLEKIFYGYQLARGSYVREGRRINFRVKLIEWRTLLPELNKFLYSFYKAHPDYPACPLPVWYPLLKLSHKLSGYFSLVHKNDMRVYFWAKNHDIKLPLDVVY